MMIRMMMLMMIMMMVVVKTGLRNCLDCCIWKALKATKGSPEFGSSEPLNNGIMMEDNAIYITEMMERFDRIMIGFLEFCSIDSWTKPLEKTTFWNLIWRID